MRIVLICWILVGLAGSTAHAEDKPWAVGVPEQNQSAAFALYDEGNKAFHKAEYKPALESFTKAIALWDHPQIRYNIAVCLINLDRPVEALDNLEQAMRFGDAPIGADLWNQGQSYKKLLAARVAEIEVEAEPGATVSLDGKPLVTTQQRVLTGDHQIVVEKPRYQTETRAVRLNGGDHVTIKIELKPMAVARALHRRWSRSTPWIVLGSGVVVAAVGVPVLFAASSSYDRYDVAVHAECPHGCIDGQPTSQHVMDLRSHAKLENNMALSLFGVGGAIAATGFAMVIINQPRLVAPVIGSDHVGLAISGSF